MIDLLIKLLTPMFVSMGASAADVANYLTKLSGYIYAVVGALIILIVILIAARWAKKEIGRAHV